MKAPPCRITDFFCAPGRTGPTRTAGPSRDNVERARRKPPTSPSPVTKRPRRETAAPPAACEGVVYLGEFLCIGYLTTCRGANLQAGDPLDISRTYVPTPPSRSRGPRSTIPPSAIPESGLGAALTAYTQRTRNTIVRFGRGPQELGRLRQDSANVVAPLLDLGLLELTAAVVYVARPATPQLGDEVVMRAQAYLPRAAFDNPTFVAWQCGFDPVVAETWDDPIATELRERVQLDAQTALHALFARCGLTAHTDRPAVPDVIDLDSSNDGGSQGETGHVPEQDLASTDDQPSVQLDALFTPAAAGAGVLDLPEHPAPPTLAYTLHPYQCQALGWMLARERPATPSPVKCGGVLPGEDLALMDPAWLRFVLPSDIDRQADDPDRFYFHPHTGQLALRFPRVGRCHAGGILADEMGLGKTIEMLALLHADAASDPEPSLDPDRCPTSATLVVCPLSLLSQWQDEARQSSRPGTVRVHLHYGPGRDLTALAAPASEPVTVVVTSYHTLLADYTAFTTGTTPARTSLFNYHFRRVILDEAHTIKARHTQSFKACYALSTTRRWAVTGTPYINGLGDLFSLLHFLRAEPYGRAMAWRTVSDPITRLEQARVLRPAPDLTPLRAAADQAYTRLRGILQQTLLRRTKNLTLPSGLPLVTLPPLRQAVITLDFTTSERALYEAVRTDSQRRFRLLIATGAVWRKYMHVFQLLNRLRLGCCHPQMLIDNLGRAAAIVDDPGPTDLPCVPRPKIPDPSPDPEPAPEVRVQPTIQLTTECPVCLEALTYPTEAIDLGSEQLPTILLPCHHALCGGCWAAYADQPSSKARSTTCPLCRHGPITPESVRRVVRADPVQGTSSEFALVLTHLDVDELDSDAVSDRPVSIFTGVRAVISPHRAVEEPCLTRGFVAGLDLSTSAKVHHLLEQLTTPKEADPRRKTVVFSQYTSFLTIVSTELDRHGLAHGRLDGTMTHGQRELALRRFRTDVDCTVLLLSLRAGGTGLNLTCASRVFLLDPWWNTAIEAQAVDRVHRLGQQRPVDVVRFIVRDTIEERMRDIQQSKHRLLGEALGAPEAANSDVPTGTDEPAQQHQRRMEELRHLFG